MTPETREICLRVAKRMACAGNRWGNCSLVKVDDKWMYRDGCGNIREQTPENGVIYYMPDGTAKNFNEVWDGLTEDNKDILFSQAYAAFIELSKIPIKQMYSAMWNDYLDEK